MKYLQSLCFLTAISVVASGTPITDCHKADHFPNQQKVIAPSQLMYVNSSWYHIYTSYSVLITLSLTKTTTRPGCESLKCDGSREFYPHPCSCEAFCQCSGGVPYEYPCPAGLEFNPELEVCDYPDVAGCTLDPICDDASLELPKSKYVNPHLQIFMLHVY